jgi:hypothetical protein
MTGAASGRELRLTYSAWSDADWPFHDFCYTSDVDYSANFEAEKHTFTGTPSQKSKVKTFRMYYSPKVDFIPLEIVTEFPNLNGMTIDECNLPTVKEGLFKQELQNIEFLNLGRSKVEVVEPKAFQYLIKLQWIRLWSNKIQTLPSTLFRNNPDLFYIDLGVNKINALHPSFFDGLDKITSLKFKWNLCFAKDIDCFRDNCPITQADLKRDLKSCFDNCANLDGVSC